MAESLYSVAEHFKDIDPGIIERTQKLVKEELEVLMPKIKEIRKDLEGKTAAIYVGGAFKAFSLIKALRHLGMKVLMVGSQTGTEEDYAELATITDPGTIIVDDANPLELAAFIKETDVDVFIGGVKERPHRLQTRRGLLRPQPRAQGSSGRLRGHVQFCQGSSQLGHEPGLELCSQA